MTLPFSDASPERQSQTAAHRTVVVGSGPAGMRAAQELARAGRAVTVLSAETVPPYNRVRLTPLLGGDVQFGEIVLPRPTAPEGLFDLRLGMRVTRIEPGKSQVISADGSVWPYDDLIIATGSRAFMPGIEGRELPGVFTFRSAEDADALAARAAGASHVVVIGGGLLGLEAAKGMRQRGCKVTVIEHESLPMPRQMDQRGGARLAEAIAALGVDIRCGTALRRIEGEGQVGAVLLADGERLACDTVIFCTGVRANIELAREAGLAHGRGITVNDQMQTSHPGIYAIGECAEHAGRMYGLVGPGYVQAEVAAQVIAGQPAAFRSQSPATKLKVIGAEVFSAGEVELLRADVAVRSYVHEDAEGYRRIFVKNGALVGAVAVGPWAQVSLVQDAVQARAPVRPWMLFRFRRHGLLWPEVDLSPAEMPDSSIICNCTSVTCGQLRGAMAGGCNTVPDLGRETGAGTVCGTCRPLLEEMLEAGTGAPAAPRPLPLWKPVLGLSGLALLAAILPLMLGRVPLPGSYDGDSLRDWLWRDNIVKQWSGFILLGITLAAMALGLRKRFRFMDRLGGFDGWRLVHIGLGLAALAALLAHTGLALGAGWNRALGLVFMAVVAIGAVAGMATGGDHELRARQIGTARRPARRLPTWLHILALWPLPVLIAFHVLASYAF